MHPLERLLNLVAMLLEARRPLTFDEIRSVLPAYGQSDDASAKRMFERDKDTLREVGIPVEVAATDPWDVEQGYRIPKERYYLPEIAFTPDEVWALFVASHAPGGDGEAEQAFLKLSTGADANVLATMGERPVAPGVDASGPHLGTIADSLARHRAVRFRYRSASGKVGQRHVHPYSLAFRRGAWYLLGLDVSQKDVRAFRLSRILSRVRQAGPASAPPEGFDPSAHLQAGPWGLGRPAVTARVAFSQTVSWLVLASTPDSTVVETAEDGWVEIEVPASESDSFVSWVLSFGPDARVRSPRVVREQVVAKLEALARDG